MIPQPGLTTWKDRPPADFPAAGAEMVVSTGMPGSRTVKPPSFEENGVHDEVF
jgi:hypothetical protein